VLEVCLYWKFEHFWHVWGWNLVGCGGEWILSIVTEGLQNLERLPGPIKDATSSGSPWYVSNFTIHNDQEIPFIIEEIHRLSTIYHQNILGHNNRLIVEISNPPNVRGRLRRQWPSDLPQPADDVN
jgi:hypothetical protein